MEKSEPSYTVGGNANWYSHYGEQCRDSLKTEERIVIWPSNPTAGYIPWGNCNWKSHMHPNVHCSLFTIARAQKQPRCSSADECIRKLWYIIQPYKGIICISSNEVDEPGAYYTEWSKSHRERQILYINAYIWNLERWYWWSYIQGSKGDTDINKRLLDSVGEGKGGMIWENSIETCILSHLN